MRCWAVGPLTSHAAEISRLSPSKDSYGTTPPDSNVSIIGSFIQRTAFPKVVRALESNLVPVEKLITHRLGLHEISTGLEALRHGQAIKVLVQP